MAVLLQPGANTCVAVAAGLIGCLTGLAGSSAAWAQRVVPKLDHTCPRGYVATARQECSTLGLMTYTLRPSRGEPCPPGWINADGGYCRKN